MRSAFHLLLPFLFVLSQATTSNGSTCGSLTKAREMIPGDAMPARYLLHQFRKLTRIEVCKKYFHLLPASLFFLGEDITIGTFMQQGAEAAEDFLWENWLSNYSRQEMKFTWDLDIMINQTMYSWEKQVGFMIRDIGYSMRGDVKFTPNEIYNLIKVFQLYTKDEFADLVRDLTCMTTSHQFWSIVNKSELGNIVKADGVEEIDDTKLKELLQTTQNVVMTEIEDFLKNMIGKLRPLLQNFHPEMESYENTLLHLQSGNNPELENLSFRMLQEIQTEDFLKRLDTVFDSACISNNNNLNSIFINVLRRLEALSGFVSQSINKHNKLDLESLFTQFNSNFGNILKAEVSAILSPFDNLKAGLKDGTYASWVVDQLLPEVFPACIQMEKCQKERKILLEHADILAGGAFRAFVKSSRIFRQSQRRGEGPACQIDCSADCPDITKEGDPDSPRRTICFSKKGCNKNLFFDPEC